MRFSILEFTIYNQTGINKQSFVYSSHFWFHTSNEGKATLPISSQTTTWTFLFPIIFSLYFIYILAKKFFAIDVPGLSRCHREMEPIVYAFRITNFMNLRQSPPNQSFLTRKKKTKIKRRWWRCRMHRKEDLLEEISPTHFILIL